MRGIIFYRILFLSIFLTLAGNARAASILLDPGHYPASPGAISCTGQKEYIYNYTLANHIHNYLRKHNIASSLSKGPTQKMSLTSRTKESVGKDLFVSLHHDSVQPQFMDRSGPYPVSEKARGYSIFVSRKNQYYRESLEYARKIAAFLYRSGLRPSTHHGEKIRGENRKPVDVRLGIYEYDDLVVLKSAKSPAVLVEGGVIVNPADERLVRTMRFKDALARDRRGYIGAAIKFGIKQFIHSEYRAAFPGV